MKPEKLRQWYVRMLSTAKEQGIVDQFTDLHDHVVHLTTIRDFPLFEGDFFPDHLRESLVARPTGPSAGPPGLTKQSSTFLVNDMKKKTKSMRKRFLVAKLNVGGAGGGGDRGDGGGGAASGARRGRSASAAAPISNALVDKRADFLGQCQSSHWQFNEVRRAHFSTMMLLAKLGGPPTKRDLLDD